MKGRGTRFPLLLLGIASALVLGACGQSSQAEDTDASGSAAPSASAEAPSGADPGGFSMSFANITNAGALQVGIRDGILRAAEVLGVDVKLYDNNANDETALLNADLMINDQPQVIADFNVSAAVNETLGKKFNEAGIPCVAVNIPIPGCNWFRLDNAQLGAETGRVMADIANEKGMPGAEATVILLSAWAAGEDVNQGVRQFYKEFSANVPGAAQVDVEQIGPQTTQMGDGLIQVDTDLLLETGYEKVKAVLPSIPEGRSLVVFGVNDDVVSGALKAIREAGREDLTIVAGLGGGAGVNRLREDPEWVAEADIFYDYWGQYILAMATALNEGAEVPEITAAPTVVMTKETVDQYYDAGSIIPKSLPAVVPENEYLVPLGVLQKFGNIEGL